jgi:hypothetical protein
MSISDHIKQRVAEGRLVEVDPSSGSPTVRPLFVLPSVWQAIEEPQDAASAYEMATVRSDLEHFAMGGHVSATFKPKPNAFLKRLKTNRNDVWEIRIQRPARYRLFGFFADQDVFVGTEIWPRDDVDFDDDIEHARKVWLELFPHHQPLISERIHDYVSEAVVLLR